MIVFAVITIFTILSRVAGHNYASTCEEYGSVKNFDEYRYTRFFFQYAGSVQCEDCCVTYFLTQVPDGIHLTYSISVGGGKPNVTTYTAKRNQTGQSVYLVDNDTKSYVLLATNYDLGVVYTEAKGAALCLFSRKAELTKEEEDQLFGMASKCNMKIYKYNPKKSCGQPKASKRSAHKVTCSDVNRISKRCTV